MVRLSVACGGGPRVEGPRVVKFCISLSNPNPNTNPNRFLQSIWKQQNVDVMIENDELKDVNIPSYLERNLVGALSTLRNCGRAEPSFLSWQRCC